MGLSVTMSLQADLRGSHPTNVVNGAPEFGSRAFCEMNPEMETVDRSVHLMLPRTDSANPPFVSSTLRSTEGSIRKGPILGSKLNGVDACSVRSLMLTAANAHTPGDDPQSVIAAEFGVTLSSRRTAMVYANPPVASADGNASENGSQRVTFDARHSATQRVLPGVKPAPLIVTTCMSTS